MDRKTFLKKMGSALAWGTLGSFMGPAVSRAFVPMGPFQPKQIDIALIYTNDTHSRVEADNWGRGGISKRAAIINDLRSKYSHTILLDAGDSFQGTPWFNRYGGDFQFKLMSKLGYQAMVLGNHEFDQGMEQLANDIKNEANFPILAANYDLSDTPLKGLVKPFTIIEIERARIGVFGLGIALDGLVAKENYEGLRIRNPISVARGMVRSLRTYKNCDMVVALSHLGYQYKDPSMVSDTIIARQVKGIDIIIGGHSHTQLTEPSRIKHPSGWKTLVTQAGVNGNRLGKIDVQLTRNDERTSVRV